VSEAGAARLRRDIGTLGASLLVLNGLIGAGIFALPGRVASNAAELSPWLFLLVGGVFLCVVLTFAALASYYEHSGGPVLYARDAFGDVAGFGTGWLLFISRSAAFSANVTVMAAYLGAVVPVLDSPAGRAGVICAATAALTWANVVGVRTGVRAMLVLTIFKITPLALLVLLGLGHVSAETLWPAEVLGIDNPGPTILLMIYAFVGFETIGVTAGETDRPRQRLPMTLVRTVIAISLFYFAIVVVFVAVVPPGEYADASLVDVGRLLAGSGGALAITVAAVFSIGGNLSSSMLAAPRLLYALAEHRMLPRGFAYVHPHFRTPSVAIIGMGILCLGLALSGTFTALAVASTLSRLLAYVVCIGALHRIRAAAGETLRQEAFTLPGGWLLPALAMLVCGGLMLQTTLANWLAVGGLLAIGILLYGFARRVAYRRATTGETPSQ
jgi:APA family basic amino acid/polyamine antiporter